MPTELFAPSCVLEVLARLLLKLARAQVFAYLEGNYTALAALPVVAQLHQLAQVGLCAHTRLLGKEEMKMPGLFALLAQLPPELREEIDAAIAAEETGQVHHRHMRSAATSGHPRGVLSPVEDPAASGDWHSRLPVGSGSETPQTSRMDPMDPMDQSPHWDSEASEPRNPWPFPQLMVQD